MSWSIPSGGGKLPEQETEQRRRWEFWWAAGGSYSEFSERSPDPQSMELPRHYSAGPLPPIPDPVAPQTPWGLQDLALRVTGQDFRPPKAVVDSSVLLGTRRRYVVGAFHLYYVRGYWSTWIVGEFVRKRTEWIAKRAVKEGCSVDELLHRLAASRERVNLLLAELSYDLRSADYREAPTEADLSWLRDPDDHPVMQTALAARAEFLVTENKHDFPLGEVRNGVWIMSVNGFLGWLHHAYPGSEQYIHGYLGEPGSRDPIV